MKKNSFIIFTIFLFTLVGIEFGFHDSSHSFAVAGVLGILIIALLIAHMIVGATLIYGLFIRMKNVNGIRPEISLKWVIAVTLLCDISFWLLKRNSIGLNDESQGIGYKIRKDINSFKSKNGRWPPSLSQIYGVNIPRPTLKNSEFKYVTNESGTIYSISYESSSWLICSISSENDEWVCDD